MEYEEARRWMYALAPRGIRLELDRMREACARMGHPERASAVLHVAGTNGKGSVSAMLDGALGAAGIARGLYTSPHLHSFTERIRMGGAELARDEVARRASEVRALLETPGAPELTFFEVATLIALCAFRDRALEVAVLEVGLGGRLDATNVAERKLACAITGIALDHQAYLGDTIPQIALEKAGILVPGVPAACAVREREAAEVIAARAREVGSELAWIAERGEGARDDAAIAWWLEGDALSVEGRGQCIEGVRVPLAGAHQLRNAATAITTLWLARERGLAIDDDAIRAGVEGARWPGRLETIAGAPSLLLDAAHNEEGARALAAHLAARGPERRVLLFGAMRDKAWPSMLEALAPQIDRAVYVAPALGRAEDPAVIAARGAIAGEVCSDVEGGLVRARALAGPDGLVVVAGSIFVLAAARAAALGIEQEPPIAM